MIGIWPCTIVNTREVSTFTTAAINPSSSYVNLPGHGFDAAGFISLAREWASSLFILASYIRTADPAVDYTAVGILAYYLLGNG